MNNKTLNSEKIKKFANKKIILGVFSLILCIFLIIVCSFFPFIIDPSKWQTTEFLTDELIIIAIVIFALVSTMFIGQASNAQNEGSNLAKARASFFESLKCITNINYFNQWVKKVLQPNDVKIMKERILKEYNIEDFSVIDLEYSELNSLLETPQKINDRYYKGLSKEQIKIIKKIKQGKIRIKFVEPNYYLSVKRIIDSRTISERSSSEGVKKGLYLTRSVVGKVLTTVLTSMIFVSLMKDINASIDIMVALNKFISRLLALISSSFMGYILGCQINDIDAEYISMRVIVHEMYLQDKDFKPMDQQEEAKELFKNRIMKESILKLEHKE